MRVLYLKITNLKIKSPETILVPGLNQIMAIDH